jgi:hypothetical protein
MENSTRKNEKTEDLQIRNFRTPTTVQFAQYAENRPANLRIFAEISIAFAENNGWPNFIWDQERISPLLIQLRYQQGRLSGAMKSIGFQGRDNTVLQALTQDIVKSSEIEGEILDQSHVRSSVARHLGMDIGALDVADNRIEGVVEMVLDATQKFDQPLSDYSPA